MRRFLHPGGPNDRCVVTHEGFRVADVKFNQGSFLTEDNALADILAGDPRFQEVVEAEPEPEPVPEPVAKPKKARKPKKEKQS